MATMARGFGRHAGLWALGLLGLATAAPLAAVAPAWAAMIVASLGVIGTGAGQIRAGRLSKRCDKLSQELDVVSQRLLQAEKAGRGSEAEEQRSAVQAELHELTVEIGLLSGIVRDLSAVVRSQDAEIAALKARPLAPPPSLPEAIAPPPAPPSPAPQRVPAETVRAEAPAPIQIPEPEPVLPPRPIPPRPPARTVHVSEPAILAAFNAGQVEILLQPVVTLPQRKVVAYEAQARLRVGDQSLEPTRFMEALERNGRTTELDRRMLARASTIIRHLSRRGSDARITYGLSPLSLFEPGFLKEMARLAGEDHALASLDIALSQASWRGLDSGQRTLLSALRGRVGFCLDRPTDLRFDTRDLIDDGISQVRVPAELLLRPASPKLAVTDLAVEDLAPALARARIHLVVNDVGTDSDVPDLIDLNVPYAQGAAFAPARPVRAEILLADPVEPPPPAPEEGPAPERRPFRSFLRQAG